MYTGSELDEYNCVNRNTQQNDSNFRNYCTCFENDGRKSRGDALLGSLELRYRHCNDFHVYNLRF